MQFNPDWVLIRGGKQLHINTPRDAISAANPHPIIRFAALEKSTSSKDTQFKTVLLQPLKTSLRGI